jgi:2-keto-3-deoxy-L-rhamnonate aldolase RhmA
MLAEPLKQRLAEEKLTVGPFLMFDFWCGHLEMLKDVGFDFAMLCCEHGSADLTKIEEICRTARLLDLPLLIRPESAVYHLIRKYMDMGPGGIMIPWTDTIEQVEALRDGVFCPPKGRRGPGGPWFFSINGIDKAGLDEYERSLMTIVQIETREGIENVESLIAPDWVDAAAIGPYDLSLNLGKPGETSDPEEVRQIERVISACRKIGKPCGMPVGTPEQIRFWMDRGVFFFLYSSIMGMARNGAEGLIEPIAELR